MGLEYWVICAIAIVSVAYSIIRCETAERKCRALEEKAKALETSNQSIYDYSQKLGKAYKELADKVEELPLDQIQTIYDSEKQFQDGLNSILYYFGPPSESEKK
jgi:septation ring formation regulator EzrA